MAVLVKMKQTQPAERRAFFCSAGPVLALAGDPGKPGSGNCSAGLKPQAAFYPHPWVYQPEPAGGTGRTWLIASSGCRRTDMQSSPGDSFLLHKKPSPEPPSKNAGCWSSQVACVAEWLSGSFSGCRSPLCWVWLAWSKKRPLFCFWWTNSPFLAMLQLNVWLWAGQARPEV